MMILIMFQLSVWYPGVWDRIIYHNNGFLLPVGESHLTYMYTYMQAITGEIVIINALLGVRLDFNINE